MTDSEIIELLQMQLKTQQQQNEFLQKTIESLNQNIQSQTETIETLTEKIADLEKNSTRIPAIHQSHLQVTDIPNRIQRASDPNQKKRLAVRKVTNLQTFQSQRKLTGQFPIILPDAKNVPCSRNAREQSVCQPKNDTRWI